MRSTGNRTANLFLLNWRMAMACMHAASSPLPAAVPLSKRGTKTLTSERRSSNAAAAGREGRIARSRSIAICHYAFPYPRNRKVHSVAKLGRRAIAQGI